MLEDVFTFLTLNNSLVPIIGNGVSVCITFLMIKYD